MKTSMTQNQVDNFSFKNKNLGNWIYLVKEYFTDLVQDPPVMMSLKLS